METKLPKETRLDNEDLATYLNKLLRQNYRRPPQGPSHPSWEHRRNVVDPAAPEVAPTPNKTQSPEIGTSGAVPAEAKPAKSSKDKTEKQSRRILRLRQTKVRRKRTRKPGDARQKVMAALIPALAAMLLLLVRKPGNSLATAAPSGLEMTKTLTETDPQIEIDWQVPPLYKPAGRDPMAFTTFSVVSRDTGTSQATTHSTPVIKGILYSEDRPATVIGTSLLHVGDEVSGAKIVKIDRNSVEFEADGRRWKQTVASSEATLDGKTK